MSHIRGVTVVAVGLYVSLALGAMQAHGEESSSLITSFTKAVTNGVIGAVNDRMKDLAQGMTPDGQLGASGRTVRICRVVLAEDAILRKIASEEFELQEGVTLHPSRSSTLQHGVSLSRSFESLVGTGIELGVNGGVKAGVNAGIEAGVNGGIAAALKADIGARVTDMLSNEIQESSSMGVVAGLDGNVLEKARVEWYARIRPGKATLEANGTVRELSFEYIVGYEPRVAVTPRRRPRSADSESVPVPPNDSAARHLLPPFGRVTAVSKEWPRLFEAQFATAVNAVKGDKLPVYRGRLAPKCIGCCTVVAVRDYQVVAECEGFTPQVGDSVSQPGVAHGQNQTRR